ncbi:cytochrome c oxidase subunit II [Gemmata sp.]|uniref:cytochrome c oxidase subunit II n=1 Tax=Gemmata sp. TaxID=1914242 RepID=UPI003F6F83AA
MTRAALLLPAAACLLAAGCTGTERQSAVDPAGVQADRIHGLWHLFLWTTAAVYALVMAALAYAVFRRRPRGASDEPVTAPPADQEVRKGLAVAAAVAVTVAILFVFLIADFLTGRRIDALADPDAPTVKVTAHQWWWEVRYAAAPSDAVTTANELHLPVGRGVRVDLESPDVIHSFWVPNLHGKTDAIPGQTTRTHLRADRPGVFWGQCAEFCGLQHANMRLLVVAEPEEDFRRWLDAQRRDAAEPATEGQRRGREVFLKNTCVMCHTVQGTAAASRVGPDLTHLASRPRIAAGTLPTTRGHLAGWVTDPHGVKPGVRMPVNPLEPNDLRALLDYLESLK